MITSEPIKPSILRKLHIGPETLLVYFIYLFKSWGGFGPIHAFPTPSNTPPPDVRVEEVDVIDGKRTVFRNNLIQN